MYGRPTDVTERVDREEVRRQARRVLRRRTWPPSAPAATSARRPSCSTCSYQVAPATDVAPGTYRNVNGTTALSLGLIAASVRSGLPLLLASYPITPASELLHELSRHASFGVRTIQAEDEIAAAGMALGAAVRRPPRRDRHQRPGDGPEGRDDRAGGGARAADGRGRRAARRARRPACRPRPSSPTCCMALHGRHGESPLPVVAAAHARRLLRRGVRGGADRGPLPHAGDPAVRHASWPTRPSRGASRTSADAAGDRPRVRAPRRTTATSSCPTRATSDCARPWALPGTPGPGAPHRRPGEGGRHRQHLLRRRPTTRDDRAARRRRSTASRDVPAARGRRRRRRRAAGARLGLELRRDPRRRRAACASGGLQVATAHLRHLNPLPANTRRRAARLPTRARARR